MMKQKIKEFNYRIKFRKGLHELNESFFQITIEEVEREKKRRQKQ